jgi:glycosyltransferase involved in cell wall biosynthesis
VVDKGRIRWQLLDSERIVAANPKLLGQKHFLVGITRIRNEALILNDTLEFVGRHVDAIIAYDDASTDRTLEILRSHPKVACVIANEAWQTDVHARRAAEHRNRHLLLQCAREQLSSDWMFCFDADERITGDLRGFLSGPAAKHCDGISIPLFDAYMTPDDCAPYRFGQELLGFRRYYGPEQRDILMLWRNRPEVFFAEGHERQPGGIGRLCSGLYCQHYGKSLSVEHWEETCDYYINHFPFETYGRKWLARKGQAIHARSDFMRPLYEWGDALFANAVKI